MSHVYQSTIDTDSDSGEVSTALFRNRDPQIHFLMKIKISGCGVARRSWRLLWPTRPTQT